MPEALKVVGKSTPRIDALERVTGKAVYTGDVDLPGMLYARVLRSPHPHARIVRIDASRALALPGVKAVLTHENCRVVWSSGDSRNKRYLFNNPVRFTGDAVAAVAAVDRHLAEEALRLIGVEYETLDFVLDPEEALKPGAVEIQPGGNLSPNSKGERQPEIYQHGDVEKGFAASDHVFEDLYISKHINNAQLERRASVATWEGEKLTLWASTQGISNCRSGMAKDLNLPPESVRVICQYMGGGFGNKNQNHDFDLMAALLSRETGHPVKLEFTRKEDYVSVHGRWPTRQHYKVGVTRDGELQAIQLRGYSGMGPYRKSSGDIAGVELYQCPNVDKKVHPAYTNTAVGANFRGPAYPQGVFGIESLMDHIAHQVKIDPVEFRLKNCTQKYHGEIPYTSLGLPECIRRGAELFDWKRRWRPPASDSGPLKRGVGMAMGMFGASIGRSSALLRLDGAGRLWVHVGVTDIGTGAKTTMALLAAEATGIDLEKVEVVWGDTDRCPYSVGESGSRTTNMTGYAILEAAKELERQIQEQGPPQGDKVLVAEANPSPRLQGFARYSFGAHFTEVQVDTELGNVKILKYLAVHDCGRIINPLTAASQVKGGAVMGIGMALHEELLYDPASGIPLNPSYYGARVMTHMDTPEIEVEFVETEDAYGPYGAKTVGEPPIIPSVAAVANAIFNATGRRIKELPMTREKILGASA
ncbi:MAG: xanthine dehydrogenase family protein molybdopterin-binding subunit [Acidobacteria bacterium]|nr:xanthine dehydrogenase family protein molybdopterin-binding subunit [Acidobacteriota bacterium]